MSRLLASIVLLLTLVGGVVIGQLTAVDAPGSAPARDSSAGRTERVRAFYDGMNRYIATGDDDFLHLLAPGFQEHLALDRTDGSAATLLGRLDAMRHSATPPEFTIEEIHDLGSLVEVRISTGLPEAFEIAGLPVATALAPSAIEFVQLQRDAIIGRWSQDDRVPRVDHALDAPVSLVGANAFAFDISRVTLDPGAVLELPHNSAAWLLLETGSVAVADGGAAPRLDAGQSRLVVATASVRVRNPEAGPAIFWLALVDATGPNPATQYAQGAGELPAGVTIHHHAWASQFNPASSSGPLRVRLAWATLPPGSQIQVDHPGVASAIAVIEGELEADVDQGVAFHCHPDGRAATMRDREPIPAGEGAATLQAASLSYRVAGSSPATVLVLTVGQASD